MDNLYKEEQNLLIQLVEAEKEKDCEYQALLKRQIGRINKEMQCFDDT